MARPAKGGKQVQVRLPDEAICELDAWVEELRTGGGLGMSGVTRSDLIRDVVLNALKLRQASAPPTKAKR